MIIFCLVMFLAFIVFPFFKAKNNSKEAYEQYKINCAKANKQVTHEPNHNVNAGCSVIFSIVGAIILLAYISSVLESWGITTLPTP